MKGNGAPQRSSRPSPQADGVDGIVKNLPQALLDAASDLAMLMRSDGTIMAVNAAMARRFELTPEQMVGERIYDFMPGAVARTYAGAVRAALASGRPERIEDAFFQGVPVATSIRPMPPSSGDECCVAVFCPDVTERRTAERERTRLAAAIEQTADAVILYDEEMRVAYVNQSFEAMTGYSSREVRGKVWDVFYVGPEQRRKMEEIVAFLTQEDSWSGRTCTTCKDGGVICCDKTVTVIRGKGGCVLGYVSVWRDMTAVEALERQLRHAQKMEALGALAGGIAHDFNNILSPIVLLADIGLDKLAEGDPLRGVFERILKAAQRASALVRQILGLGRRFESDQPVPFRLTSILHECLKLLRPTVPSSIDIHLAEETTRDVILADPAQIHQLVMNLCTNAVWAMRGAGGVLELRVSEHHGPEERNSGGRSSDAGSCVLLSVTDSGHGIESEHLEHIFDPFFTTKQDGSGTGLGLAVVRNIVDRLGGGVRVRSEPGQGARFDILLPRSQGAAADGQDREEQREKGLRGCDRILVVDDEVEILDACAMGLTALGYAVTTCSRGEEARDLCRASPRGSDLALVDATMPGLAGPDLVRELLKLNPHLPIILTTGHSEVVSREKTWRLGAMEYLAKPYRIEDLASLIRRILDGGRPAGRDA